MRSFLDAFDRIVARFPERVALEQVALEDVAPEDVAPEGVALEECPETSQATRVRYSSLDRRSRLLAEELRAAGAGPETVVALYLPRSADFIVAMLAVWRAGAAFLPLDVKLPAKRIQSYLEESGCEFVIARKGESPAGFAGQAVAVDARSPASDAQAFPASGIAPDPARLAYLVFTSGSSGRPRAVALTHAGILPVLRAQIEAFALASSSRALWMLSPGFDASLSDIGTVLLSGATLVIHPDPTGLAPAALLALLESRKISHIDLPPAMLPLLNEHDAPAALRAIVVGGEVCDPVALRAWAARVRLVNVYGPSEATICTSMIRCSPEWEEAFIGRPLPGVSYEVRDSSTGMIVVPGQSGELYIGGNCLARGYHGDEASTARKFKWIGDRRLYRSGDLVREHADGSFEFLGRVDRQMKLRGLRIEPGEIEAYLREDARVQAVAVVKRETSRGPELLACVELRANEFAATDTAKRSLEQQLRSRLADVLPAGWLPARWLFLKALPRNHRAKIDFATLERIVGRELSHADEESAGNSALSPVAKAWRTVLGLTPSPRDDFFASGGDSLKVLKLVSCLRAAGFDIVPTTLYRHSRFQKLEEVVSGSRKQRDVLSTEPLKEDARRFLNEHRVGVSFPVRSDRTRPSRGKLLLTGSTGFLGSRLLEELLRRGQDEIICLVRAKDAARGFERIIAARARYGLPADWSASRVRVVAGDVARERLGLAPAQWKALRAEVDAVYHSAATVDLTRSYDDLRATNVGGLTNILGLFGEGGPRRLNYVSTLALFVGSDLERTSFHEEDDPLRARRVHGGYARSKWAAEYLLRESGAPATIFRLGLLSGDSRTGAMNPDDWLTLTIRDLIRRGSLPRSNERIPESDLRFDWTPVDFAAAAIAQLSMNGMERSGAGPFPGNAYHIANSPGLSLGDLRAVLREEGFCPDATDAANWFGQHDRAWSFDPSDGVAALALCRLAGAERYERDRPFDLFQCTGRDFAPSRARDDLRAAGLVCSPASREDLRRIVRVVAATLPNSIRDRAVPA